MGKIAFSRKTINAMSDEYRRGGSLAEIGERYSASRGTVRKTLADNGVRIRSKTEHHSFKTGGQVTVANLPAATPAPVAAPAATSSTLLEDLLKSGHISQAEINSLANSAAPVPASATTTTGGMSFDGMSAGEKERAGIREVMRIVKETSKISNTVTQQEYADLYGRSGSWASKHQPK